MYRLIKLNGRRGGNGAGTWSGEQLPFLLFPFRLDGPQRPTQPRRDVRGQTLPTERHTGVHQIHYIPEHRSVVPTDSLSNKNARAEARRDPIY